MKKIAIVGGGISGLTTAYYLLKQNPQFEITVFEASDRAGGIIRTMRKPETVIECGPDTFFNEKPAALDLCRELGLESEVIPTQTEYRRSFILSKGKLAPIPAGFYLTAPRTLRAWATLPGMSWRGKLRMLADLFLPARKDDADESVADFVTRRFGRETLVKLAQPMIAGVYTSNPEKLSLLATFPQFRRMEKEYGSVIRALAVQKTAQSASGARYNLFSSLRLGMSQLIESLQNRLGERVVLAVPVTEIKKNTSGWTINSSRGEENFDAICVSAASYQAAELLNSNCPALAQALGEIQFEPVIIINYVFSKEAVGHPLDGFGFVVPAEEKSCLIGCSFLHRKFAGRALDSGRVILRAFLGGALGRELCALSDAEVSRRALEELGRILSILKAPLETIVTRWDKAMPQYEVNHHLRVERIENELKNQPGLFLTGYSYRGIGIPDCVKSARETAENMARFLQPRV